MFSNTTIEQSVVPAIAVRGIVPLPNNEIRLEVGRVESIAALKVATETNKYLNFYLFKKIQLKNSLL